MMIVTVIVNGWGYVVRLKWDGWREGLLREIDGSQFFMEEYSLVRGHCAASNAIVNCLMPSRCWEQQSGRAKPFITERAPPQTAVAERIHHG